MFKMIQKLLDNCEKNIIAQRILMIMLYFQFLSILTKSLPFTARSTVANTVKFYEDFDSFCRMLTV